MSQINTLLETLSSEETISQENLDILISGLSEADTELASRILNFIGDLTRHNENREFIGAQQEIVEKIVSFLNTESSATHFAARAVANLAYQHEKNRKVVVDLGAPHRLVGWLKSAQDPAAQRNFVGALANVSFVEDELQKQLADQGVLELLLGLLDSDNDGVVIMSLRAIANLVDSTTRQVWRDLNGLRKVVNVLFSDRELEQETLSALSTLLLDCSEELIAFASTDDWLAKLHALARDHEDEEVRNAGWELLYVLVDNDDVKPIFTEKQVLFTLLEDARKVSNLVTLAATLQIVAHLATHNSSMDKIFKSFDVFFAFLSHENEDIKMYTTMVISNIARKDEYCARLVSAGAVPLLSKLAHETRSQHLALGALRNIAIPNETKTTVANQEGLIELILNLFKDSTHAHVLYNGVLLLKALCSGGLELTQKVVSAGLFSSLPELWKKTLQEGHERIFYEAGRLVAIVANTNSDLLDQVIRNDGLKGIKKLFDSPFELLHQEGLTVVTSASKNQSYIAALVDAGIVESLVPLLSSSANDLKLKVLVILGNISHSTQALQILSNNDAQQSLNDIAVGDSEEMKIVASKVLSLLPPKQNLPASDE